MKKKVLIVEDDVNLGTTLAGALEMQEYTVSYLTCGDDVQNEIRTFGPDIIILDVMLNGRHTGFELAHQIRLDRETPILFTTSLDGTDDLQEGFSIRNTDYIRKPYKLVEVTLRMTNLLAGKENAPCPAQVTQIGSFSFDLQEQSLRYNAENIQLSSSEAAVLNLLCKNKGKYLKREVLIKTVWCEEDHKIKEGTLNNIITKLRKYLKADKTIVIDSRMGLGIRLLLEK